MNNYKIDSLVKRIDRLETRNRQWAMGFVVLVLGGFIILVAGAIRDVPDELEARRFVLRDKDGKERARLAFDALGNPDLELLDKEGNPRVDLFVDADGIPTLNLADPSGKGGVLLAAPSDTMGINVRDKDGKVRLHLGMGDHNYSYMSIEGENNANLMMMMLNKGEPALRLRSAAGPSILLHVQDDGRASFNLMNIKKGDRDRVRATMSLMPDGLLGFDLLDPDGKTPRLTIGLNPEGLLRQTFNDKNGRRRIVQDLGPDKPPSISILDEQGNPVVQNK
jgi:hypothetical protein